MQYRSSMATLMLVFVEMLLPRSLSFLSYIIFYLILNRNSPPINWPILGMLPGILNNTGRIHEYVTENLKRSGYTKIIKGPWFSKMEFVVTCDPMNIHHVLSKNFINYPKGAEFKMIMEPLGDGILNVDGDLWKTQRRIIHSSIKHRNFKFTLENVCHKKLENGLIPVLRHVSDLGIVVDMQDVFQRFTFDNVCNLTLGFDPNCLSIDFPQVDYAKAFDDMEQAVLYRHVVPQGIWRLMKWIDIGEEKKLRKASETFEKFISGCISSKREKLRRKSESHVEDLQDSFDLISSFILDNEDENEVQKMDAQLMNVDLEKSDKFLKDVAFNLLAAGRDAVSVALTWFVWLVATHSSVENKILEEIKVIKEIGKVGHEHMFDNIEDLNKLVYLHAVLCETLRLYPPIPFNHKTAFQADILPSGQHVKKGTKILLSFFSMGRIEEIWGKDCYEFKPERWISENGCIRQEPSYKYAVFNAGPRTCLGKDISFIQMKMVAIAIIWNYHIELVEGHPITPRDSVVLQLQHGLKVRVSKRHVQ